MYSADFRRLAFIKLQKLGGRIRATARHMEVSPSTISRWCRNGHWSASVAADRDRKRRRRRSTSTRQEKWSAAVATLAADATIVPTAASIQRLMGGDRASYTTVRRYLRQQGLTRKRLSSKMMGGVPEEDRLRSFARLEARVYGRAEAGLTLSVDECHFSERVLPLYGYSRMGERCRLRNRKGSWKSFTLLMALGNDGSVRHEIFERSVNRQRFSSFIERLDAPDGTVVLLDNCSVHKKLEDVFARKQYVPVFLPPYSPQKASPSSWPSERSRVRSVTRGLGQPVFRKPFEPVFRR